MFYYATGVCEEGTAVIGYAEYRDRRVSWAILTRDESRDYQSHAIRRCVENVKKSDEPLYVYTDLETELVFDDVYVIRDTVEVDDSDNPLNKLKCRLLQRLRQYQKFNGSVLSLLNG